MNRRHFLSSLLGLSGAALCPELLLDLLKPRKTMIVVPEWKPSSQAQDVYNFFCINFEETNKLVYQLEYEMWNSIPIWYKPGLPMPESRHGRQELGRGALPIYSPFKSPSHGPVA